MPVPPVIVPAKFAHKQPLKLVTDAVVFSVSPVGSANVTAVVDGAVNDGRLIVALPNGASVPEVDRVSGNS